MALGGEAIVLAYNETHAESLVASHANTQLFDGVEIEEIPLLSVGQVLHNWNGDY